jgi:hypothetical protein
MKTYKWILTLVTERSLDCCGGDREDEALRGCHPDDELGGVRVTIRNLRITGSQPPNRQSLTPESPVTNRPNLHPSPVKSS